MKPFMLSPGVILLASSGVICLDSGVIPLAYCFIFIEFGAILLTSGVICNHSGAIFLDFSVSLLFLVGLTIRLGSGVILLAAGVIFLCHCLYCFCF